MYFISFYVIRMRIGATHTRSFREYRFFGEIVLIKKYPRTFSVKVLAFCDLLVLITSDFQLFLDNNPETRKPYLKRTKKELKWMAYVDASSLLQISNCTHATIRAFVQGANKGHTGDKVSCPGATHSMF